MRSLRAWGNLLIASGLLMLLAAGISFIVRGSVSNPQTDLEGRVPSEAVVLASRSPSTSVFVVEAVSSPIEKPASPSVTATFSPSETPTAAQITATPTNVSPTPTPSSGRPTMPGPGTETPANTFTPTFSPSPTGTPLPSFTPTLSPTVTMIAVSPTPTVRPTPAPPRIAIAKIGLIAGIVPVSWHVLALSDGFVAEWETAPPEMVGHHQDSAQPGERGNVVLSGHSRDGGSFARLSELDVGDEILVYVTERRPFRYVVQEKVLLPETGASLAERMAHARYLDPTEDARLTLVTCWPSWAYTHRLIIIAKLQGSP